MNLSALLPRDEIVRASEPLPDIGKICHRSAELTPDAVFVCMKGKRFDSHSLIGQISSSDAAAVVADADSPFLACARVPAAAVRDTRETWAAMWSRFCNRPQDGLTIYGITGTNGKTSTSSMLARILSCAGRKTALIGTLPPTIDGDTFVPSFKADDRLTTMTTPDPDLLFPLLRDLKAAGVTDVVMEVSSQALDAARVAPILFDYAAFTNLSPEHLDSHGDMAAYAKAKSRLFRQAKAGVVNGDDPWAEAVTEGARCPIHVVSAAGKTADFSAAGIRYPGLSGVSYTLVYDAEKIPLYLPIPGHFSVANSLLASSVALKAGIRPSVIRTALSGMPGVKGRMEKVDTEGFPFSVFIDYAHTPAALRSLLLTFRGLYGVGRIILVFGCGGDRDKSKRKPMGACAEELADVCVVTSDNARGEDPAEIIREILAGFSSQNKVAVVPDREQAIRYAVGCAGPDDVVLIVGKGHETYEISKGRLRRFSEKEIVADALCERRKKEGKR